MGNCALQTRWRYLKCDEVELGQFLVDDKWVYLATWRNESQDIVLVGFYRDFASDIERFRTFLGRTPRRFRYARLCEIGHWYIMYLGFYVDYSIQNRR